MPSAVPSQLLPSGPLAAGVASATAFPSAASLTSAGATSASSLHVPISILSAGSAAAPAPEESVSTVCACGSCWWGCSLCVCVVPVKPSSPQCCEWDTEGVVSVRRANPQKSAQGQGTKTLVCSEN